MAQRKGLFGVDWGAVGEIAQGIVMGEPERVVSTLSRDADDAAPTEPAPAPADPDHPEKPCGARYEGQRCNGHTPEGACIMVKG